MSGERTLVVSAPAKINLGLRVLSRRPDGYHQLRTRLASVDLRDTLRFEPGGDDVRLACDDPTIPTDGTNLVLRAAARLEGLLGRPLPGVRIRLEKRIPAGRGLGGGSSDAAAALVGLNRLLGLRLPRRTLHRLLAEVGMDAPFFLYGGLCLATGRGEQVFPLSAAPALPLVILVPDFGIATPDAYRGLPPDLFGGPPVGGSPVGKTPAGGGGGTARLSRFPGGGSRPGSPDASERSGQLPAEWFRNDLERSLFVRKIVVRKTRPPDGMSDAVSQMRRALTAAGATAASMSGSGSAVFGVFADREGAERAASRLAGNLGGFRVRAIATRTISRSEHRAALFGGRPDGAWPSG